MLATPYVLAAAWLAAIVACEDSEPAGSATIDALAARVDSLSSRVDALQAQLQALQESPIPPTRHCFTAPPPPSPPPPVPPEASESVPEDQINGSLHEAAARDDARVLEALLRHGQATVDGRDARGDTALHVAAREGAAGAVRALLRRGAHPGARGALLRTPLHAAAARGHLESARLLAEAGAPVEARDARGATAMALAAEANPALREWLVQRTPWVEWADAAGDSPLLAAARGGEWARAQRLAEGGAAPAARGRDGATPLLLAARAGPGATGALEAMLRGGKLCDAPEVARALAAAAGAAEVWAIAQAAPEEVAGAAGQEALRRAARDGRAEALAALLAAGVDPALPGADGRAALQLAASAGHVTCVRALLPPLANRSDLILSGLYHADAPQLLKELDAAVPQVLRGPQAGVMLKQSVRDGRCDVAALLMGLETRNKQLDAAVLLSQKGANATCVEPLLNSVPDVAEKTEIVKRILKDSKSFEILSAVGKTVPSLVREVAGDRSLSEAVERGQCYKAVVLLAAGVSGEGTDGERALTVAVNRRNINCVRKLLSGGVEPLTGSRWESKLRDVARDDDHETLVVLLAAGVRVDASSIVTGRTALMLGSEAGHVEIVRELLEANAQANRSDVQRDTALTLSSRNGHVEVIRLLLNASADVNAKNKDGASPLIYASWYGHPNAVRELLKANADVNASDVERDTALTLASKRRHLEVVKLLLAANADVDARNKWGKTALDYATELNLDDIKHELEKAKAVPT